MPSWPETLPEPLLDGFSVTPNDNALRTDFEQGNSRVRRRYTAVRSGVTIGWLFETDAQMAEFVEFWKDELLDGTEWFDISLNLGAGRATQYLRFMKPYSSVPLGGGLWRVSGEVETGAT